MSVDGLRWRLRSLPKRAGYDWGPRVMSRIRKWWVLARNPHATIRFEEPVYLGPGFSLHCPDARAVFIAHRFSEFRRNFRCEIVGGGRVEIGEHSRFTYDALIQCSSRIDIGEHCMFGQSAFLVDGNHRFRALDRPMLQQGYDFRPLRIADHVTVLTKCSVLADLGERCVIGAHSVVTREIPAFTVALGVPARVHEYFGPATPDAPA